MRRNYLHLNQIRGESFLVLLLLGLMIFFSGCVTISMSVESKVNKDGFLEYYKVVMNMSEYDYKELQKWVAEKGYPSLKEYLLSLMPVPAEYRDHIEYIETRQGEYITITMIAKNVPPDGKKIIIEKKGRELIYKDTIFTDKDLLEIAEKPIRYYLEMPGRIIDSNSYMVDENKAKWSINEPSQVYARCKLPSIIFQIYASVKNIIPSFYKLLTIFAFVLPIILIVILAKKLK